jgi:predicted N-formylglutamate amidohydrolase
MLLCTKDPAPVTIVNPDGKSPFLFIGDHAGKAIPAALGSLGVGPDDLSRHIGWDIGIGALGEWLAHELNALFVRQTYSRLVIDCNRDPGRDDAIPEVSDGTPIPGNRGLTAAARAARVASIHAPYQDAIARELERRQRAHRPTVLIALHSFTPRMADFDRPWQIGILHNRANDSFALNLLDSLRARGDLVVGDNEPYQMDKIDYTIPRHAFAAGLPYAEIEIRQDLIGSDEGGRLWGALLRDALVGALAM